MNIGIDPNIFDIGSRPIEWHGVLMVLGIILAVLLSGRVAAKKGIAPEAVYTSAFWIILFGLIGSRISHVIDDFSKYSAHPADMLAIWEGGMGWYGGLLGGIIGLVVYTKLAKIPLGKFADTVAIGGALGLAIGRLGCTTNGDAYGTTTSLPWGLTYTHLDAYAWPLFEPGHPAPVYEIIWIFGICIALWALSGRKIPAIWLGGIGAAVVIYLNFIVSAGIGTRLWVYTLAIALVIVIAIIVYLALSKLRSWLNPPGSLFLATVALYSFGRFFISWVRGEDTVLGPLHQSHIFSIILFVVCVAFLAYRKGHFIEPEAMPEVVGGGSSGIEDQ